MTFAEACQEKFARGQREHGDAWDAEHVDWRREAQDELIDLYHYVSLSNDEVLTVRVQSWCKDLWHELEDLE